MPRRIATALVILASVALLAGCVGGRNARYPGGMANDQPIRAALTDPAMRACLADLGARGVRFTVLPNQYFASGCHEIDAVKLIDVGLPTTNLGALTCPMARALAGWVDYAVRPAARQLLGSDAVRVDTFGSYACRNINGAASGRLSQHAFANAVDIAGIDLADGRHMTVLGGWYAGDAAERQFWRVLRASACRRFGTVLSPDYNALHRNHLHFDMQGAPGSYCR